MTDTDSQTEAHYRRMLMARSPEERFLMGLRMCEAARATVLASLPAGLAPIERKIALLRRYYGSDFGEEELARIEGALRLCVARHERSEPSMPMVVALQAPHLDDGGAIIESFDRAVLS